MEILTGVLCLLNIVDMLFKVKERFHSKEELDKVSNFLHNIGMLLQEVASDLEQNRYPHEKCAVMHEYMISLKDVLHKKLDPVEVTRLQELIEESYRVEKLLGELNQLGADNRTVNLSIIRTAAGSFLGLSELVKLK